MNCREILQTYGPIYSHLADKQLFDKIADLAYRQIGHGVSREYWKTRYGRRGTINASNIRRHISEAVHETGAYSDAAMIAGLKRYRARKRAEADALTDLV